MAGEDVAVLVGAWALTGTQNTGISSETCAVTGRCEDLNVNSRQFFNLTNPNP